MDIYARFSQPNEWSTINMNITAPYAHTITTYDSQLQNFAPSFCHSSWLGCWRRSLCPQAGDYEWRLSYIRKVVSLGHVGPRCYLSLWAIRWQFRIPTEFSKQKYMYSAEKIHYHFHFHIHQYFPISIPFPAPTISISLFLMFVGNEAQLIGNEFGKEINSLFY
jgi:hypothetical protein